MCAGYDAPQVVGLDLHRRRTVMVRMSSAGQRLETVRFASDPRVLAEQIGKAGPAPEVVLEATYGWYWAADVLAAAGARLHLAHPLGVKGFAYRRVKTDARDAGDLADLLRMGRLPEAWVAPPRVRELRELVRHRHKLRQMATGVKAGVHAVLAKNGVVLPGSDIFAATARPRLDQLELPAVFRARVDSQLRLLDAVETEITGVEEALTARLGNDAGYRALLRLDGIGPVLAAVLVAEIGDIHRFPSPRQLCSWAGLTPRHRESDTRIHRGRITKQGAKLVRWAAIEAVQHAPPGSPMRAAYDRITARRGEAAKHIARVAAARVLLTCVYYALRDGHVRRLQHTPPPSPPTSDSQATGPGSRVARDRPRV